MNEKHKLPQEVGQFVFLIHIPSQKMQNGPLGGYTYLAATGSSGNGTAVNVSTWLRTGFSVRRNV